MLIRAPLCKTGKVFKHLARVRVKNMRSIFVYEDASFVVVVVGIAADMWALITNQDFLIRSRCQPFGEYAARETAPTIK